MSDNDNKKLVSQFDRSDVVVIKEETVWNGFFKMYDIRLKHKLFAGGWSGEISRELFHRGQAAACVIYDPRRDLIGLIDQFRVGALDSEHGPWCLEVVAGMLEHGETPEELILRELEEEAGVKNPELIPITSYYSTPGGCSEKINLFCALCDLGDSGGIHGLDSEDEDIFLHIFPATAVFDVMLRSRMNNAATLIALQWLQIHRNELKEKFSGE